MIGEKERRMILLEHKDWSKRWLMTWDDEWTRITKALLDSGVNLKIGFRPISTEYNMGKN
jgi:hypothetical protein